MSDPTNSHSADPAAGHRTTRRQLLSASAAAGLAIAAGSDAPARAAAAPSRGPCRVSLTAGDDRADNAFRALQPFAKEVARSIGSRRVVVKPNNVLMDHQLAASDAKCLEGILEFLKSIGKLGNAVIAESAANGSTLEGFDNYGYPALSKKYGVKLVDLDAGESETHFVLDGKDLRPQPVRMAKLLMDPGSFILSAAKFKTHDRVVATLSLKNVVVAAPIKDLGFGWGRGKPGTRSDKATVHGGSHRATHYNLYSLAQKLAPHLALIDGYEGMEGNGPNYGSPVDHRVCVAGPDWLAADRVAAELMGVPFGHLRYLNYCADAGMGTADLTRMEILGEPIARHVKTYKLADNLAEQLA
ncbi:MAG TPA: DUF362 domain-containing protein [Armatimonadota bacterium]